MDRADIMGNSIYKIELLSWVVKTDWYAFWFVHARIFVKSVNRVVIIGLLFGNPDFNGDLLNTFYRKLWSLKWQSWDQYFHPAIGITRTEIHNQ